MAEIDPRFKIGIPEMDAQHARWIEIIERFRATAADRLLEPEGHAAAVAALNDLIDYTRRHFSSEEKMLAAHAYPKFAEHCAVHRAIERQLAGMHEDLLTQKTRRLSLKLNLFATIWLFEHIMGEDADYANFLNRRGVAVSA